MKVCREQGLEARLALSTIGQARSSPAAALFQRAQGLVERPLQPGEVVGLAVMVRRELVGPADRGVPHVFAGTLDKRPDIADAVGIGYIRTLVEGAREYVRHTAVRRSDQLTTHHHGEADHLTWLERPFDEALRALEERGRG